AAAPHDLDALLLGEFLDPLPPGFAHGDGEHRLARVVLYRFRYRTDEQIASVASRDENQTRLGAELTGLARQGGDIGLCQFTYISGQRAGAQEHRVEAGHLGVHRGRTRSLART